MSSRRQSSRVTKSEVDYKEYDDTGLSDDEAAPAPAKRRKIADSAPKKAPKRRKGKLSKLPDMPLDVLYEVNSRQRRLSREILRHPEIFSRLHPEDLLKISWTTKAFRRVLTTTSSKTVWMNSFASVDGLPACPDDMNEVEYASLLFNPFCQVWVKIRSVPSAFSNPS